MAKNEMPVHFHAIVASVKEDPRWDREWGQRLFEEVFEIIKGRSDEEAERKLTEKKARQNIEHHS